MTRQEALKVNRLLNEIESLEMLQDQLDDLLASEQFENLPNGVYTELHQVVQQYLTDKKDELGEM